ncbi:response regulator [Winogradskyella sp.]|uniref:response regulator n=1 Tax=Winogradskyella sp. TaxID=1883156 RepID=UPI003AB6917E
MRILYLDDDAISRLTVSKMVNEKYDIDAAETTTEFFSFLEKNTYDIFLIDINLNDSDIDGFGVLKKLNEKNLPKETIYIAHTNYFGQDWETKCIDKGFSSYLAKPFNMPIFEKIIKNITNKTGE